MDDGYCYGRSKEVLPAIRRFADRLTALGLHLQFRKCSFYSPRTGRTLPSATQSPGLLSWGAASHQGGLEWELLSHPLPNIYCVISRYLPTPKSQ